MKNIDAVVVPVGGGGLIAGVALAVKSLYPHIQGAAKIWIFILSTSNLRLLFIDSDWRGIGAMLELQQRSKGRPADLHQGRFHPR